MLVEFLSLFRRYNVLIMLTTYVIPIAVNCVATCHMSLVLWYSGRGSTQLRATDVETEQFRRAERKKKKVCLAACWGSFVMTFAEVVVETMRKMC